MKKITLFLVAVCTTVLMACGGSGSKAIVDLYEKATKDIASIESVEALTAFEVEINQKGTELGTGVELTEAEVQQVQAATAKYSAALQARALELAE